MADPEVNTANIISGGGIYEEKMIRKATFAFKQKGDVSQNLIFYSRKGFEVK